jgi:hypothetical protein
MSSAGKIGHSKARQKMETNSYLIPHRTINLKWTKGLTKAQRWNASLACVRPWV